MDQHFGEVYRGKRVSVPDTVHSSSRFASDLDPHWDAPAVNLRVVALLRIQSVVLNARFGGVR